MTVHIKRAHTLNVGEHIVIPMYRTGLYNNRLIETKKLVMTKSGSLEWIYPDSILEVLKVVGIKHNYDERNQGLLSPLNTVDLTLEQLNKKKTEITISDITLMSVLKQGDKH